MRCATNDWTAPSQSCTSPSCRKANALSSTHKIRPCRRRSVSVSLSCCIFLHALAYVHYTTHSYFLFMRRITSTRILSEEIIVSVNTYTYVSVIDNVTKCHFLWNGDQCEVLLKTTREQNQSSSELWTGGGQSRAFLRGGWGGLTIITIIAAKPYSALCYHREDWRSKRWSRWGRHDETWISCSTEPITPQGSLEKM